MNLFTNYVDKILASFDHLPSCVNIFYGINDDNKWTFLDHLPIYLPTSSCKRSLWTTQNSKFQILKGDFHAFFRSTTLINYIMEELRKGLMEIMLI